MSLFELSYRERCTPYDLEPLDPAPVHERLLVPVMVVAEWMHTLYVMPHRHRRLEHLLYWWGETLSEYLVDAPLSSGLYVLELHVQIERHGSVYGDDGEWDEFMLVCKSIDRLRSLTVDEWLTCGPIA